MVIGNTANIRSIAAFQPRQKELDPIGDFGIEMEYCNTLTTTNKSEIALYYWIPAFGCQAWSPLRHYKVSIAFFSNLYKVWN